MRSFKDKRLELDTYTHAIAEGYKCFVIITDDNNVDMVLTADEYECQLNQVKFRRAVSCTVVATDKENEFIIDEVLVRGISSLPRPELHITKLTSDNPFEETAELISSLKANLNRLIIYRRVELVDGGEVVLWHVA